MKNFSFLAVLSGALLPVPGLADPALPTTVESAWLAFANARGEPSLILGDVEHPTANAVFRVIPDVRSRDTLNEEKLQLGADLFHEVRLSRDASIACSSCHVGLLGGVDRRPVSFGIAGAQGVLNAPTVFNAALNFRQFWDGRALTLQEQALGPIQNAAEFGHDLDGAVAALKNISDYVGAFERVYPDGITAANLGDAIAYYEIMNFTGLTSAFLRQFEEGPDAMSPQARRGQQRFVEVGCASCHNGINLGGNSYQLLGVAEPWYGADRISGEGDAGLSGRTGRAEDRHVFKVPTLHNVAATGPWLHDGSITSLQQAVDRMAKYQSGRYLENRDIDDIVAFLRALGDSASMLGDCSMSGGYTITMDCSMNQATTRTGDDGLSAPPAVSEGELPAPEDLIRRHREEYNLALERVSEAPARIQAEMQRLRAGEVAHFDFLQFEHIEMLRHARALWYPPANLDREQHQAMLVKAAEWQRTAEEYELVIADFLRAQAVAGSARANYQDLLRILSVNADEKTRSLLAQAEHSAQVFFTQPGAESQLLLEGAIQALQDLGLNSQHLEEIQQQVRLLVENIPAARKVI